MQVSICIQLMFISIHHTGSWMVKVEVCPDHSPPPSWVATLYSSLNIPHSVGPNWLLPSPTPLQHQSHPHWLLPLVLSSQSVIWERNTRGFIHQSSLQVAYDVTRGIHWNGHCNIAVPVLLCAEKLIKRMNEQLCLYALDMNWDYCCFLITIMASYLTMSLIVFYWTSWILMTGGIGTPGKTDNDNHSIAILIVCTN